MFYLILFSLKYGEINCGVTWAERTAGAHRLVAHRCAAMGVFTRHQWAPLPAHKESGAWGCAQCESPLIGTAVRLRFGSILQSVTRGALGSPASSRWGVRPPQTANSLCTELRLLRRIFKKTERDGAELKLHEQRATSYLAAGSTRVACKRSPELEIEHCIQPILGLHPKQFNEEEKITSHK